MFLLSNVPPRDPLSLTQLMAERDDEKQQEHIDRMTEWESSTLPDTEKGQKPTYNL